ncbi:MAG: hypothetical protein ACOVOQ_09000 [Flavobacterium sp.]
MTVNEAIFEANKLIGLKALGFDEYNFMEPNHIMSYERTINKMIQSIQYSYIMPSYNGHLALSNISSGIVFTQINNILEKVISSLNEQNEIRRVFLSHFQGERHIYGEAITFNKYSIQNYNNLLNQLPQIKIINSQKYQFDNLIKSTNLLREYIESNILPFFNTIYDLQQLNDDIINRVPQMEIGKYITGMLMCYKKQIIMKLCHNLDYDKYTNWLLELNKIDYENGKERFNGEYEFHTMLIDFLSNMN